MTKFIAEVSSNHHKSIERCIQFIETSAHIGCDAVKFQLFRIEELFAPEILTKSEAHRQRKQWELPVEFIPQLRKSCDDNQIQFSCTPFYLEAIDQLAPYVHFFKIASYELLWSELLIECAKIGLPIVLSTGMATLDEIDKAMETLRTYGANDITLLHCVSAYPAPIEECNLAVLGQLKDRYHVKVGWSDHSVSTAVLHRAIHRWQADIIEFHLDLDKQGAEYAAGHCWLPEKITNIISNTQNIPLIDGSPEKTLVASEASDRNWRADPSDGLRPMKFIRKNFRADHS